MVSKWGNKGLSMIHGLVTVISTKQHFIQAQNSILVPTKKKRKWPYVVTIGLTKMLGKKTFNICESASRSYCVVLQVASLLYVLHHGALHVAFQHIHHSHGDANCGSCAPGASECWGGTWCHQYCRQHHYWRKRANRYLPMLAILFLFISDQNHWHRSQILLRSGRVVWFVLPMILVHSFSFCIVIFLSKLKESFKMWWKKWSWETI